jgi:uncharacterized membrane protein
MVMKSFCSATDTTRIEERLKEFESKTGCELLLVVANASDAYPAASLRFGLIAGFLISLTLAFFFEFPDPIMWPLLFLLVTLLMIWVGHFEWAKAWALSTREVDQQCDQRAIQYFHTLGTTQVSHKVTAMIMVSRLEHKIEVLVDSELKQKIFSPDLEALVIMMGQHFKAGLPVDGFIESIATLEKMILAKFGGKVSQVNPAELDDRVHFIDI